MTNLSFPSIRDKAMTMAAKALTSDNKVAYVVVLEESLVVVLDVAI